MRVWPQHKQRQQHRKLSGILVTAALGFCGPRLYCFSDGEDELFSAVTRVKQHTTISSWGKEEEITTAVRVVWRETKPGSI